MSWAKTRLAARLLAIASLAAFTTGCFQPMYAERSDGTPALREKLQTVEVAPMDIPGTSHIARVGIEVRNALIFKIYGSATSPAAPAYRLVLRPNASRSSLMVSDVTKLPTSENYGLDVSFGLIEIATGKQVMTGNTFARVTYDIPGYLQRFARQRAMRDAEDRAAQVVADHIQTRLASFFYSGM